MSELTRRLRARAEYLEQEVRPQVSRSAELLRESALGIERLEAALAAVEQANRILRIEAGNAAAARKQYEEAWRQSQAELTVAERERDEAKSGAIGWTVGPRGD